MNHAAIEGAGGGSLKTYLTGFILSLILTAIPFALVMSGGWSSSATLAVIFIAGAIQIFAHLHYFLHVDTSSTARWNIVALLFTIAIMVLFVGGTIWILFDLNYRMM